MTSVFIKEQYPYSKEELISIFKKDTNTCIKKLKEYSILKTIKNVDKTTDLSDLEDFELVIDESDTETEHLYVFTFVGVIIVNGFVLKCYPKYIFKNNAPQEELAQVVRVLERYNSKEQIIKMYVNNQEDSKFNRLAAIIYLLLDYYENGVYNNTKDILETNGRGEINWNRTVNETYAIINNNRPYYTEIKTIKHQEDTYDFFRRLHEYILTACSHELMEVSLCELLGVTPVELSEETLDDFGEKTYVLYRIENEIKVQFNTRKIELLKTFYMFLNDEGTIVNNSALSLYGTNTFHTVWENVCAEILKNRLETKLRLLPLPVSLHKDYVNDRNKKLIEIIDVPTWFDSEHNSHIANKTLIPDIISIIDDKFLIFDAKYYNLVLEPGEKLNGNPGVGDVTKQYLYQLAYKKFISDHGFTVIKNCFLMPTEEKMVINKGYVTIKMMASLGLEDIQIRLLPASVVFDLYLMNQKIDLSILKL